MQSLVVEEQRHIQTYEEKGQERMNWIHPLVKTLWEDGSKSIVMKGQCAHLLPPIAPPRALQRVPPRAQPRVPPRVPLQLLPPGAAAAETHTLPLLEATSLTFMGSVIWSW